MTRLEILKEAHRLLKEKEARGICIAINRTLEHNKLVDIGDTRTAYDFFPLLDLWNAESFGGKDEIYWWKPREYSLFSGRRRFMRWLMWMYRNDKEDFKPITKLRNVQIL